jgi:hypothetical protein
VKKRVGRVKKIRHRESVVEELVERDGEGDSGEMLLNCCESVGFY